MNSGTIRKFLWLFIPLGLLLFNIACWQADTTSSPPKKKYMQSPGNHFLVELIDFEDAFKKAFKQEVNGATFILGGANPKKISDQELGHTFYFDQADTHFKYVIKLKNIASKEEEFKVNIQGFTRKGKSLNRNFNPGNFDFSKGTLLTMDERIFKLKKTLVRLTYK